MKKVIFLIMALMMCFAVVSCSTKPSKPSVNWPSENDTVFYAVDGLDSIVKVDFEYLGEKGSTTNIFIEEALKTVFSETKRDLKVPRSFIPKSVTISTQLEKDGEASVWFHFYAKNLFGVELIGDRMILVDKQGKLIRTIK